jgi:hypothetical protein
MTLLAYRPLARGRAATDEEREAVQAERPAGGDNPGLLDGARPGWSSASAADPSRAPGPGR